MHGKKCEDQNPVQVYCRLRPLNAGKKEKSCMTILSDTTVQVVPPKLSQGYRNGTTKVRYKPFSLFHNYSYMCV